MIRASRRRWFLLACTSLAGSAACGQTVDAPPEQVGTAQQAIVDDTSFAIYAANSVSIGSEAHVVGGRVGVKRTGQGPSLIPGYEIAIATGAVVSTEKDVHADSLLLQAGSTLGAIHANDIVDHGANHGTIYPFGAMPALPIMAKSFPGTTSLAVPANTVVPIPANIPFDRIVIGDNATLRLAGGVYHMQSLTLGQKSRLEADAPTVLRIAGRLLTGEKSFIGPSTNAHQVVLNMRIEVEGTNGNVGGDYRLSACGALWRES